MKAIVNAASPMLSPDPDLGDVKEEERERHIGLVPKRAGQDSADSPKSFQLTDPTTWAPNFLSNKDVHPWHLAVLLSAAYAAGRLGVSQADRLKARGRRQREDKEIRRDSNELDKLRYDEYVRTRGFGALPKNAADKDQSPGSLDLIWRGLRGKPAEGAGEGPIQAAKSAWWVWAVPTFLLAWAATRSYSDKRDPNRIKIKQLRKILEQNARVQQASHFALDESTLPRKAIPAITQRPRNLSILKAEQI